MQKMAKVDLIFDIGYAIINKRRTNVSLITKKKYIRKLTEQFSNVLNHGYAKANPNPICILAYP